MAFKYLFYYVVFNTIALEYNFYILVKFFLIFEILFLSFIALTRSRSKVAIKATQDFIRQALEKNLISEDQVKEWINH